MIKCKIYSTIVFHFIVMLTVCVALSFFMPLQFEIVVQQQSEKNQQSKSNEVWILKLGNNVVPTTTVVGKLPAGWVERNEAIVLVGKSAPDFKWNGIVSGRHLLTLKIHGWSGKAKVQVNEISYTYDLYNDTNGQLVLSKINVPVAI